ncbi:MAG TPA: hypothetical protein VGA37_14180 [Gemmatimonadales bacterium]
MTPSSERAPAGGLGRRVSTTVGTVFMTVAFVVIAPIGLLALPLTGLIAAARPRNGPARTAGVASAAVALWWLTYPGELPEQVTRAAAVLAVAAFLVLTLMTTWTVTHRSLVAAAVAAGGVAATYGALGWSWGRLHWWVEHRVGFALRWMLGALSRTAQLQTDGAGTPSASAMLRQLDASFDAIVRTMADLFPATVALQVMLGFAVASLLFYRLAGRTVGRPLGRFTSFRFTEHLGWAAVVPLVLVLFVRVSAVKLVASNILAVVATLYVVRGAAVGLFGLQLIRAGVIAYGLAALATLFLLPVVLGSTMVLGVLDAGLDLRRRWTAPPVGG